MASSDEEGEIVQESVTNYWLIDQDDNPASFTDLPLQWSEDKVVGDLPPPPQILLRGSGDDGLQEVCKQVVAWRFELSYALPEILVLTKHGKWIRLQNPKKSFEELIRSVLITVHSLHHLKKNRESLGDDLWTYLPKAFGSYEMGPSIEDLIANMSLIREAIKRDKDLANSEYLLSLVDEDVDKVRARHKDIQAVNKSKFIADDMEDIYSDGEELDETEEPSYDTVCAICDNGGEILACDGVCMRSFHATKNAGVDTSCEGLGLTDAQVEAIPVFECENCKSKKHQCFACGRLGSSDAHSGAEVFSCFSGTCGHFYHPNCVAELLHPTDKAQAEEVRKKIIAGESFVCPVHKCSVCRQIEDKTVHELQLAVCRRCPKAYHRKCLPRKISFESLDGLPVRAWEGLLPNRILIYCLKHAIDPLLGTPVRNHIRFRPDDEKKKTTLIGFKRSPNSEGCSTQKISGQMPKSAERTSSMSYTGDSRSSRTEHARKPSIIGSAKRSSEINQRTSSNYGNSQVKASSSSLQRNSSSNLRPYSKKQQNMASTGLDADEMKDGSQRSSEDDDMEARMLALIKESNAKFDEEYKQKQKARPNHAMLDKSMTLGTVKRYVEAARTALQKLDEGCSVEEAKEICEPAILNKLYVWRRKLRVYMAPFLYGPRYTSFGRHFTKSDKLKEVVNRLQWYVQNGDTVVDFCCGSNEFSCLLNEKLEKIGKRCSFKNYDLFPPQNTFNFEKRDWMKVELQELPSGSKLIMGLNPPFGVEASLANKFISKALEFKPKLLILIVPDETRRLDTGPDPYDLIWRDRKLLAGKAFYLPGSIDKHDRQLEDWNNRPPSLYLWSRPDWTSRHKALAEEYGHAVKDSTSPDLVQPSIHDIEDMVLDMDISPPELQPGSCTREVSESLPENQQQHSAPTPSAGELQQQGYLEEYPNFTSISPVYSQYGLIQPPPYPYYPPPFTYVPPTVSQATYDPFTDCLPTATQPDFPDQPF